MFKSQLQEYVQKAALPPPAYESVKEGAPHEPRFKATVTVNGVSYESAPGFTNLKAAEHAAARVALAALLRSGDGGTRVAPAPVHESGLCKNLLQEYAQKSSLPLPVYRSTRSGEDHAPTFTSTVEIAGVKYSGGPARSKKEAEIKAARTALLAIQTQAAVAYAGVQCNAQEQPGVMTLPCTGDTRKRARQPCDTSEEVARGKRTPMSPTLPMAGSSLEGEALFSPDADARKDEGPLLEETRLRLEAPETSTQDYEAGYEPSSQDSCLSQEVRVANAPRQKSFCLPLYPGPMSLQSQLPIHAQPRQLLPIVQLEQGASTVIPGCYRFPVYMSTTEMQQFGITIPQLTSPGFAQSFRGFVCPDVHKAVGQQMQHVEGYKSPSQKEVQAELRDGASAEAAGQSSVPVSSS